MDLDILHDFLDHRIVIEWQTQDDLERCADAIEQATGGECYDRRYIRGYSSTKYPYMCRAQTVPGFALLKGERGRTVYSPEHFLAALGAEEEELPINCEGLL